MNASLDWYCSHVITECDALVAMSGMSLRTIRAAKKRFGATAFLERSSQHIEAQREILQLAPSGETVPDWVVRRELLEYQEADQIVTLSSHCVETFLERGVPAEKVSRISLGVDTAQFSPRPYSRAATLRILFVGTWSYRKGCDILAEAAMGLEGVEVVHVGSIGDLNFTAAPNFRHFDAVDEAKLVDYYGDADVFVLPSREDGFGVVLLQALACNRRVIASDCTGGPDLVRDFELGGTVRIVRAGSVDELRNALTDARDEFQREGVLATGLNVDRYVFDWRGYGLRYNSLIRRQVDGAQE
ncbi:glycosyltransferase family 4 protein [Planctomycetota bacterium]|nr:glycosyltransferase family 4 protein [Planctomycetota bacterium]